MLSIHGRMNSSSSSSSRIVVREQPIMYGKQILVLLPSETHHNTQLLHSISSFDSLQLPHWQSLRGRENQIFPPPHRHPSPIPLFKHFAPENDASTIILVESTTLCLYVVLENTQKKLLNIQTHRHTHTHVTLKKIIRLYRKQLYMPVSNPY